MWYIWNRVDVVQVVHEDVIHHITRVTVTLLLVIIWVRLVSRMLVVSSYCTGKYQQIFIIIWKVWYLKHMYWVIVISSLTMIYCRPILA